MDFQVIIASPYWAVSGVNTFSANLARGLQSEGISAQVLLTEQNTGLVTIKEPLLPLPVDFPVANLPVDRDAGWGEHWRAMAGYLEERAPCIYIPNHDWRHSIVSSRLSDGVCIVGVVHSDDPLHYDHAARLGRYWNAVVTTSRAIADRVATQLPALSGRIHTIPIGVPAPECLPKRLLDKNAPLRIIYHGNLVQRQKRILDLPRIAQKLCELGIPIEIVIIGDGVDRERLAAESKSLIKAGVVKLPGLLPHREVLDLLGQHDVFILTSEYEGMPNALLEAMGQGCVPVVSDINSGIPQIINDGVNGFRVPVGDIETYIKRLTFLYKDPVQRGQMARAAHKTVTGDGYLSRDMVKGYITLFKQVRKETAEGYYHRPRGKLELPPQEIDGIQILPGDYAEDLYEARTALSWKKKWPPPLLSIDRWTQRQWRRVQAPIRRNRRNF